MKKETYIIEMTIYQVEGKEYLKADKIKQISPETAVELLQLKYCTKPTKKTLITMR